jgi:hypothetical protein
VRVQAGDTERQPTVISELRCTTSNETAHLLNEGNAAEYVPVVARLKAARLLHRRMFACASVACDVWSFLCE